MKERVRNESKNLQMASKTNKNRVMYLPSAYHWQKLDEFQRHMLELQKQIEDVDELFAASDRQTHPSQGEALQNVLKEQHDALITAANHVARLHNMMDEMREDYRRINPPVQFEEDKFRRSAGGCGCSRSLSKYFATGELCKS